MKRIFLFLVGIVFMLSLGGCAPLLIGGGVVCGVAITNDTVRLEIDKNFDRAWEATYEVMRTMGTIDFEDKKSGEIEATIIESEVKAQVSLFGQDTTRIEIKARKGLFPNLDLATDIINKISKRL